MGHCVIPRNYEIFFYTSHLVPLLKVQSGRLCLEARTLSLGHQGSCFISLADSVIEPSILRLILC